MVAATDRKSDRNKAFYLIIVAALLYNLFLWFASRERAEPLAKSKNELTSTLTK